MTVKAKTVQNNYNYSKFAQMFGENVKTDIHNAVATMIETAKIQGSDSHQFHSMQKALLNILKICEGIVNKQVQRVQDSKDITLV
jgi:hypothetical protein